MTDQPLEPEDRPPKVPDEPEAEVETEAETEGAAEPDPGPDPGPEPEPVTEVLPPPAAPRRLYRSRDDEVIAGVCGGLGKYFDLDSTLFRIGFVLLVFAGGAGLLAYALAWIFVPEEPVGASAEPAGMSTSPDERTNGALIVGLAFVVLGAFFLFDEVWPDFLSWRYVWPLALIVVGVAVLARSRR